MNIRSRTYCYATLLILILGAQLSACGEYAAKGAGSGATTGAVSGAVGGMVGALVFGGDPVERAVQGAVVGGAVGATAGAMGGSQIDSKIAQERQAKADKLRKQIGDDAFTGLQALAECDHNKSLSQANVAQQSSNPNFARAGLWLEVLTYADQGNNSETKGLYPKVVEKDWDISSEAQAETTMRQTLVQLMDIRQEYGMPRTCSH